MGVSFVTVGNFNIDNVVTADGRLRLGNIGGNAIFSAIGAHIWSSSVGILSVIPKNYPASWLDELNRAGIDLEGVVRASLAVDLEEWFFYKSDGSRVDHIYAPSSRDALASIGLTSLDKPLAPDQVSRLLEWVRSYPAHSGISFNQFREQNPLQPELIPGVYWPILGCHIAPNRYSIQLAMAKAFKAKGVLVSLDPSMDLADQSSASPTERLQELLGYVDIFLPSLKELRALFPNKSNREAILAMAGLGPPAVIGVKLGEHGSLIWDRNRDDFLQIPVYPSRVNDLTGAGDAYCGGFLVGMIESGDPFIAAGFGSVSASLLIERDDVSMALRFNRYQASPRLDLLKKIIAQRTDMRAIAPATGCSDLDA